MYAKSHLVRLDKWFNGFTHSLPMLTSFTPHTHTHLHRSLLSLFHDRFGDDTSSSDDDDMVVCVRFEV